MKDTLRFFDTKRRGYVEWRPPKQVRMYVCGITPYDSAHIGHIFTFMMYDLLQRRLEDMGREVVMVRNITDVDEPIYRKAAELGMSYTELAARETEAFHEIMDRMQFLPLTHEPKASEYLRQMAEAVSRLLKAGYAYTVDDDIYFDISRDPEFGRVACFDERLRLGLFSKRGGDPARPGKRQPMDFLLWKAIDDPADPAAWDFGVPDLPHGRPGWHIECTVMSSALLGVPFDLHGGGNDLIFPHHEAEISQGRALDGVMPASRWLHVAPMYYGGEKMSKSLGNLVFAGDLLEEYSADAIRIALMQYHYREGGEWIPEYLDESEELIVRLRHALEVTGINPARRMLRDIRRAIDNDLDTHAIMHALGDFTESVSRGDGNEGREVALKAFGLLGLRIA
jgi:L-cysteine:1D-myo-inositol 2-amino-2-deoxy-alpha-D-glucopyranoside ligase